MGNKRIILRMTLVPMNRELSPHPHKKQDLQFIHSKKGSRLTLCKCFILPGALPQTTLSNSFCQGLRSCWWIGRWGQNSDLGAKVSSQPWCGQLRIPFSLVATRTQWPQRAYWCQMQLLSFGSSFSSLVIINSQNSNTITPTLRAGAGKGRSVQAYSVGNKLEYANTHNHARQTPQFVWIIRFVVVTYFLCHSRLTFIISLGPDSHTLKYTSTVLCLLLYKWEAEAPRGLWKITRWVVGLCYWVIFKWQKTKTMELGELLLVYFLTPVFTFPKCVCVCVFTLYKSVCIIECPF